VDVGGVVIVGVVVSGGAARMLTFTTYTSQADGLIISVGAKLKTAPY